MANYLDYGYETADISHIDGYIYPRILKALKEFPNPVILDLGCGNGALVKILVEAGFDAYGTDASEKGIRIAQKSHPERFFLQDLENDDIPEVLLTKKFNVIISTEVIEHLYTPRVFIKLCHDILSPQNNHMLLVSTPYHGYLKNLMLSIFNRWDKHMNPLWDGGHIKLWSKNTVTQLMEEQKFKVNSFEGCGRFPYLWKSMLIKAALQK